MSSRDPSSFSESEYVRHLPDEIVFGRGDVDFNHGQCQTRRFLAEDFREHPIAFDQVAQGSFRITRPGEKVPRGSTAILDHCLTKVGRREEPDGTIRDGEERLDEVWQRSKSFDDHTAIAWETEQVFDDEVEALSAKPVKRLEHCLRRSVQPSFVHVHRHELVQQRAVFG